MTFWSLSQTAKSIPLIPFDLYHKFLNIPLVPFDDLWPLSQTAKSIPVVPLDDLLTSIANHQIYPSVYFWCPLDLSNTVKSRPQFLLTYIANCQISLSLSFLFDVLLISMTNCQIYPFHSFCPLSQITKWDIPLIPFYDLLNCPFNSFWPLSQC